MKVLGVTGGIGSGKTTVCKIFSTLGVPVFYSDDVSKEILFSKELANEIARNFGKEVFISGVLSRQKLAAIVFKDKEKLKVLNSILHPKVAEEFVKWKTKQTSSFVIKEAAILFESGAYKSCDWVLNVSCSSDERLKRVVKRDGRNPKEVKAIMEKQWSDSQRKEKADFVIENEKEKLLPQVIAVFNSLKN